MGQANSDEIVKKLLDAKHSMEKTHDFASKSMGKAREMNPVAKLRVMQLHQEIESLKGTKGQARKSAAAKLARLLVVRPRPASKSVSCNKCWAQLTPGAAFCHSCGAKV